MPQPVCECGVWGWGGHDDVDDDLHAFVAAALARAGTWGRGGDTAHATDDITRVAVKLAVSAACEYIANDEYAFGDSQNNISSIAFYENVFFFFSFFSSSLLFQKRLAFNSSFFFFLFINVIRNIEVHDRIEAYFNVCIFFL